MVPRTVLLVVAVSLPLLLVAATATEEQEQGVEKRVPRPIQTPLTPAVMAKILVDLQQRMKAVESSQVTLLRGKDGRDGIPGKNGRDGLTGKPGKNGRDGLPATPGKNGRDGLPGTPGSTGLKGSPGNPGVRGPPGPKSGGVQYVRWGKTICPSGASLIYKGRVGGEYYGSNGGGTNYVCLPETPKYGRYKPGRQFCGKMYGTEYELSTFNPFTKGHLHDHEAPCAVCYVATRSVKMMIPATYECPAGWTREYHGYLMTEYYGYPHPADFICVDNDAEAVPGTQANSNGAMLFPVEFVCGALPCHSHVTGRELTCAVCTK